MKSKGTFVIGLVILLLVLGGGAFAIIRTQSQPQLTTISCVGGSEKTPLMADPDIKRILHDKYQLAVEWKPQGSYDQVLLSADQIRNAGYDCLWPSSASAQNVFETTHAGEFGDYRALTVLQSPEVVYSGPQATDALVNAGLVRQEADAHYVLDLKALLLDNVLAGNTWQQLQAGRLQGPVNISSTDPARSNSGFTMAQLQLMIVATQDVTTPPTIDQARAALPTMRKIYDAQGLQASSSDNGFRQWLSQGGELQAPLYAGYESQIMQLVASGQRPGALDSVRIIYPEPTIYSDHPVLALNPEAFRFAEAMTDPEIQRLAWTRHGFRSAVDPSYNNLADFEGVPLAETFRTVPAPSGEVSLALLNCLKDRTACTP